MKKIILFMTAIVAVLALNGCGGVVYDDYYDNYDGDNLTTLFLVDENGFSYANVPYKCDSMTRWSRTASNGEFSFLVPDSCEFDFNGLNGVYGDSLDDVVRIVDDLNRGKGGIPYECSSFGVSSTYGDGSFDYNQNDSCVFYLN